MDKTWTPSRRLISRNPNDRTGTPLRPWPTPGNLPPIRPPPPSYVERRTKYDDRRLEADTWSYIRCELNLERERINPNRSIIVVVPVDDEPPGNGLGDREHRRQESWGAGQQVASHQGAWQQGAWPQGAPQHGASQHEASQQGAWQQGAWQQQMVQPQQVQQQPPLQQQGSGAASGAAYGTATPDAGPSAAEDSKDEPTEGNWGDTSISRCWEHRRHEPMTAWRHSF